MECRKDRYKLISLAPNVMAYAVKEDMRDSEPPHLICANCYNQGQKRFLNQTIHGSKYDRYNCGTCKEELEVHRRSGGAVQFRAISDYDPYDGR